MPTATDPKARGSERQTIAVYLTRQQVEFLTRKADEEETSVSELVRRAIREYFSLGENTTEGSHTGDAA